MKEKKTNCGVYKIINLIPDKETGICKVYIGSSENLKSRKYDHFNQLARNKHHNVHLQRAFNRDKEENFKWEVIKYVEKYEDKLKLREELLKYEQYYIDGLESYNPKYGYNIRLIADSNLGIKRSKETIEKIRRCNLGKKLSEEHKNKISTNNKGKNLGKKHSEETKEKMSNKAKERTIPRKNGKIPEYIIEKTRKKVINLDTNEIFISIHEAAKAYNISIGHLSNVCRGLSKTAKKYRWSFYINGD
jgi:group I intron endonuclease